jgi:hypothetical protein
MSQGKKIDMDAIAGPVERAIINNDYPAARKAMAVRLARMFDNTDSARDLKATTLSLEPLVTKCEQDFATIEDAESDNPLNHIMAMAEDA